MTPTELDAIRHGGDLYALGVRPSGVRPTDFVATPVMPGAAPPAFTHPVKGKVPVRNQQGSTCVGNSIATCMAYLEFAERGEVVPFDGELLNMRVVGRDYGTGSAASPHDVLDDVLKHGIAGPGGLYFPRGYAWVDWHDQEALKAAIAAPGQMVTASVWLTHAFDEAADAKTYAVDVAAQTPWSYHQLTFVGYDAHGVLCQNSWGTWWGDRGFVRLGWDYIAGRLGECWSITDNADTVRDGYVKTYDYGTASERAIKRADMPGRQRPAVYRLLPNGREWIKDPFTAKRMGVDLHKVEILPDTDGAWNVPLIGPDAPAALR